MTSNNICSSVNVDSDRKIIKETLGRTLPQELKGLLYYEGLSISSKCHIVYQYGSA